MSTRDLEKDAAGGDGLPAWYPRPSTPHATKIMKANPRRDTRPEVRLRSALHQRGMRFRCDYAIADGVGRPIRADVAFTRLRLAVFVDGCFWHMCPDHGSVPKANLDYWRPKLEGNARRDAAVDVRLQEAGWEVVRLWEHMPLDDAVAAVIAAFRDRSEGASALGDRSR
ncbi:MAG: very short patch repair endonuclease [Acidimicrobiales bacterium]